MALITVDELRLISGVTTDLMTDEQLQAIIDFSEKQTLSTLKVFTTPQKVVDIRDGNGKNKIRVNRPYVWKVLEIKTRNDSIDLENINIEPISSIITVDNTQNPYYFYPYQNSVKIKYLSAFMEKTIDITETTGSVNPGSSVIIPVEDETIYSVNDWVVIEGFGGDNGFAKLEAAQITATATNQITVDLLTQTHEAESVVTKLQTHELLVQYILYDSATNAANFIIGNTSDLPTGFNLEGAQAQIGVAYTHWQEASKKFDGKRNEFKNKIMAKLNPMA